MDSSDASRIGQCGGKASSSKFPDENFPRGDCTAQTFSPGAEEKRTRKMRHER